MNHPSDSPAWCTSWGATAPISDRPSATRGDRNAVAADTQNVGPSRTATRRRRPCTTKRTSGT